MLFFFVLFFSASFSSSAAVVRGKDVVVAKSSDALASKSFAVGDDDDDDYFPERRRGRRRARALLGTNEDDDEEEEEEEEEDEEEDEEKEQQQRRRRRKAEEREAPEGCFWTRCSWSRKCPRSTTTTNNNNNNKNTVITVREEYECESSFLGKLIHYGGDKAPTEKLCCDERAAANARWERGAKWAEDGNEDACFNRCPKNSRCNARHGTCECDVGYVARDAPKDEDDDDDAAARMHCYPVREDQTEDLPIGSQDVPEIEDPMLEKERMIEKEKERREKIVLAKKKKIADAKRLEKMKRNKGKVVIDEDEDEDDFGEDDIVKQPTQEIQKQLRNARRKSRMGSKEREKRKRMRKQKESRRSFYFWFFILTILAQVFVCARLGVLTNVAMRVFGKNPRKLLRWRDSHHGSQLLPTRLAKSRERLAARESGGVEYF
jgi:hypothetical protein